MKEDKVAEEKQAEVPQKNNKKGMWFFIAIAVVVIILFLVKGSWGDIDAWMNPPPEQITLSDADIGLYKFNALTSDTKASVELWLLNTGQQPAKNLSVFVRCRNDTGMVLYEGNISLTAYILRNNETCSGLLEVEYTNHTKVLYDTVEITWGTGRAVYEKQVFI